MGGKWRLIASMLVLVSASGCFQEARPKEVIEGKWVPVRVEIAEGTSPTLRYESDEGRLRMTSSTGSSYSVDIGGGPAVLEGVQPGTTVSVQKLPAAAYSELVMRGGRPVSIRIISVADSNVVTVLENRLDGSAELHAAIKR